MSSAFEGIFCAVPYEKCIAINSQLTYQLPIKLAQLSDNLSSFSRVENYINWVFSEEMELLAAQISELFSQAVLVRYDNRVGYRESTVFQKGSVIKFFNLKDEIWVMLDEDGEAIVDGKQFSLEEIDSDNDDENEYETIKNAIQLGVVWLGSYSWKDIHTFITNPRRYDERISD